MTHFFLFFLQKSPQNNTFLFFLITTRKIPNSQFPLFSAAVRLFNLINRSDLFGSKYKEYISKINE